jgi:hypothetical protein
MSWKSVDSQFSPRREVVLVDLPPPAAMADALNTAAAFLESKTPWRRSTTASKRPSIL